MIRVLAIAAIALAVSPAWAVNKCAGPDGVVVFQDAPCAGKGETVRILGAGRADPNSPATQYWQREAARQKRSEAVAEGKVSVGMSAQEVRDSWGNPTKINKTVTGGGASEQWVYRRGRGLDQYVYLENGVVRTIQSPE